MKTQFDEEIKLSTVVTEDGIVELTLAGNISSELHGEELTAWVRAAKETIVEQKAKQGGTALCITDIGALREFDDGSVEILKSLASGEEVADVKSAVIGGSLFSKMALRTIILVTGRKNIKPFDSRESALVWLKSAEIA